MFIIVVMAFGNAILILDRFEKEEGHINYAPLFEDAFSSDITDSFINQFMVGVGEFSYSNYVDHPNKTLLWIYFILATFLT